MKIHLKGRNGNKKVTKKLHRCNKTKGNRWSVSEDKKRTVENKWTK
jgi:hypothetical protein